VLPAGGGLVPVLVLVLSSLFLHELKAINPLTVNTNNLLLFIIFVLPGEAIYARLPNCYYSFTKTLFEVVANSQ
jgi:hypothetical protein